jgi:hypothetical protein
LTASSPPNDFFTPPTDKTISSKASPFLGHKQVRINTDRSPLGETTHRRATALTRPASA